MAPQSVEVAEFADDDGAAVAHASGAGAAESHTSETNGTPKRKLLKSKGTPKSKATKLGKTESAERRPKAAQGDEDAAKGAPGKTKAAERRPKAAQGHEDAAKADEASATTSKRLGKRPNAGEASKKAGPRHTKKLLGPAKPGKLAKKLLKPAASRDAGGAAEGSQAAAAIAKAIAEADAIIANPWTSMADGDEPEVISDTEGTTPLRSSSPDGAGTPPLKIRRPLKRADRREQILDGSEPEVIIDAEGLSTPRRRKRSEALEQTNKRQRLRIIIR